jgi:hypothetical protein
MIATKRPQNLNQWVFWAHQGDIRNFDAMLGGNESYIKRVRVAERPVIMLSVEPKKTYRFSVCLDCKEGFSNGNMKLKPSIEVVSILTRFKMDKKSKKNGIVGLESHPTTYCFAGYKYLHEAIEVANALTELDKDNFFRNPS